jgi:hypothetical protein
VVLGALLAACGSDPPPPATYECGGTVDCSDVWGTEPSLEVGEGDPLSQWFSPLGPDPHLPLESGPQGGYHVYLNFRARGICPSRVAIERTLRLVGEPGEERVQHSYARLIAEEGGTWTLARAPLTFICPPTRPGHRMDGVPLEVDVTVSEDDSCVPDGGVPRAVSATVGFVAECPAGDLVCQSDDVVGCDVWSG